MVVLDRHARQLVLKDVGVAGQRRLQAAHVVVVGCGGLGAPVIAQLAAAGVGHLTLIDDDVIEGSNLNRQTLFTPADLGKKKAEVPAARVAAVDDAIAVVARVERLTAGNVGAAVNGADVVVDCADGLPTKYLLNDACVRADRPLVHGAATTWSGQVLVVPGASGPCLRCLFPVLPAQDTVPTCRTAGITAPVTGVVGSLQAAEVLKLLWGIPALVGRFVAVDIKQGATKTLRFDSDPACPCCGDDAPWKKRGDKALRDADYLMPLRGDQCEDDR